MKRWGNPVSFDDSEEERCSYSVEFQMMLDRLDEEDCLNGTNPLSSGAEKKRRLSLPQINVLEKNFEQENKLEPERKVRLAEQLGLHPRQVAVWFQNRRARWKTKQLEREYDVLKANYDTMRLGFAELEQEKAALSAELEHLKGKVLEKDSANEEHRHSFGGADYNHDANNTLSGLIRNCEFESGGLNNDLDSDSFGNFNAQQLISPAASSPSSFTSPSWSQISGLGTIVDGGFQGAQSVKMGDKHISGFYETAGDSCNFLSVDDAPTLCWYFANQ